MLDDSGDCLDQLRLFQPNLKTGLDRSIADSLEAFLMGKSDKDMRQSIAVRFQQNIPCARSGSIANPRGARTCPVKAVRIWPEAAG